MLISFHYQDLLTNKTKKTNCKSAGIKPMISYTNFDLKGFVYFSYGIVITPPKTAKERHRNNPAINS